MIRWPVASIAAVALVVLPGCNPVADRNAAGGSTAIEQRAPDITSVTIDLEPVPSTDGSEQWICTYNSAGKTARFKIDFGVPESIPGKTAADPPVKSGEGTLLPEPGSDSSVLLADLQKALHAKTAPKPPQTKTSVPFTYIAIGENLSEAANGFSANPPGNWTARRIILGDGDRESEIFLHLNAGAKKARFSMKDPNYGDLALSELAKVL
jgi:hypothetical protein